MLARMLSTTCVGNGQEWEISWQKWIKIAPDQGV